jgi:hypothetical protein
MFLEEKLVVTKQDTTSKDTFFLIDSIFQSNKGLRKEKCQKSVTYYLNGPLILVNFRMQGQKNL